MNTENKNETLITSAPVSVATVKKTTHNYFKVLARIFTPNKSVNQSTTVTIVVVWLVGTLILWLSSKTQLIPTPLDLFYAGKVMFLERNLVGDLLSSLILCMKAMFYAIVICYTLATLSTMKFFEPIAGFFAKSRFLTTVGLSTIFAQLTPDTSSQKTALLVFGITVFLVTSFLGVLLDIKKEEYDYAKTLKMNNWQAFYEIVILGRSDLFIEAIRQNFAIAWMMLPMVENICRVDGGIGIILTDQSKYFHLDSVYAIQISVLILGIGMDWFIGWIKGAIRPDSLLNLNK